MHTIMDWTGADSVVGVASTRLFQNLKFKGIRWVTAKRKTYKKKKIIKKKRVGNA